MTEKDKTRKSVEWGVITVVAVLLALSIRMFVIEPRLVQMSSMFPTIEDGDFVLVNKLAYATNSPKRNDIIVFEPANSAGDDYIKRIVGLPGEWIEVAGGHVTINGVELTEAGNFNFIEPEGGLPNPEDPKNQVGVRLQEDEFYVLGDNSSQSRDSRAFGPIKGNQIIGRAFITFMPINRVHILP
ncbi:MAG TPA: signal peptidase I [Caldisericia bacterium]|nr:signal peptidase I [Caldisericia bacterium]HPF48526.1 signal peptidase I [Caldisericia bacterium]HPI84604.1 signal peptidase I [Caldisericia bacterium]HPQ92981.1 signal peptidase I [Caldisericia bacterium]HRV75185.1 signal peptidase I [Caldisericia bacterium]